MKSLIAAVSFATALTFLPLQADASGRYTTPPPLGLSADLSSPWTLQLKPKRRIAIQRKRQRVQRPVRLKRVGDGVYRPVNLPRSRRAQHLNRNGVVTGSIRPSRNVVNSSASTAHDPSMAPAIVSYDGSAKPGTIIVNTIERRLYLIMPGGKARRYAIGVGKPGFEWAGTHRVTRKAEWPSWTPPKEMIAREARKGRKLPNFMPGGPQNPMGARALYLGSTIYRIHGTNQAWSIGKAVSSGCIRMLNEDVMDLYERVPVGARVKVI